ncbi:protein ALP1-like [Girardinichthys multiradiatus]|uniref:protein ALP1-like n=1 Tax=Girardinichthys multiradiatus TaxID=208333 RepID=UPI001FAC2A75|nr:protein ALP1-like [Girardinichthys multiradiatus]
MVSSLCVSVWLRLSQTVGWYRSDGTEETTLILAQPALRRGVGGDACEGSTVGTGAMCHRYTVWTRPLYCRINLSVPVLKRFFTQEDTRPDFWLSRESLAVLLNLLHHDRRHGWGATIEILVFLIWLVIGTSYRVICRVFGMPRSTVHRIVHRVTEEIVAIRHQVIYLLKTPEDLKAVSREFAGLARHRAFLKAVGAIDGCHIRIRFPSSPDGQCYKNRKLFPSIILQAVSDHQSHFIDTYVGWPGSVHDSRVD